MNNTNIINNLDRDKIAMGKTIVVLTYQGYLVNKVKYKKLFVNNLLTQLFNNFDLLSVKQQEKANLMYDKYITLCHG